MSSSRRRPRAARATHAGQLVLDFTGPPPAAAVPFAPRPARAVAAAADAAARAGALAAADWFHFGCELEETSPAEAASAYRRALALDPDHHDALLNLGRLQHEAGELGEAEACYRRVLSISPGDAVAAFNLGVALEDRGDLGAAAAAYEAALAADPHDADACYNLAGVYERLGRQPDAVRWLKEYRRLRSGG